MLSPWDEVVPDPLTGVPVLADFERELARVLRRGEPDVTVLRLALLPVGAAGDAHERRRRIVLAAVNWQEVLRPADRLARVADDRFAVLLPDCPLTAAARVVDRLRDATPPGAMCAVGAATWDRQESGRRLLARASDALDAAPQLRAGDVLRDPARVAAVAGFDVGAVRAAGTLDRAAAGVAWLLQEPTVTISLIDDRRERVVGAFGDAEPADRESAPAAESLAHGCVVTGRPLVATDAQRHPALHEHPLVIGGTVGACASVPLITGDGHVVGAICATRPERHAWTSDEVRLLRSTAGRVVDELARVPAPLAV